MTICQNKHNYYQNLPEYIYYTIGSNDITKTSCDNVNAEDLAQRISNIAKKKLDCLVLAALQFQSFILMKTNVKY